MTSLIDVIFLLLLFFMLSSTFSRFGEIALATGGTGSPAVAEAPRFLRLGPASLTVNAEAEALDGLAGRLAARPGPVLVALLPEVTAQRLTDLLAELRRAPGLAVTVLE
jgi:biopolymer transport protein ExbD